VQFSASGTVEESCNGQQASKNLGNYSLWWDHLTSSQFSSTASGKRWEEVQASLQAGKLQEYAPITGKKGLLFHSAGTFC